MSVSEQERLNQWLSSLSLSTIRDLFRAQGATEILFKVLPRNANSKNQVYLAPDLSNLGKIPSGQITAHQSVSTKAGKKSPSVLQARLDFYWLASSGNAMHAPNARLIFYPQYPEVRFSGFLLGCKLAPSDLYSLAKRGHVPDRILFLGLGNGRKVLGLTVPPESPAAQELLQQRQWDSDDILKTLPPPGDETSDAYTTLMQELCRIHRMDWVAAQRLHRDGSIVACNASNGNGNTLEALLGIASNSVSEPDFLGWEIKARSVPYLDRAFNSVVTLFTPEPTAGVYQDAGVVEFVRRYGYPDKKGRPDRINFGGIHRCNQAPHQLTGLRLVLEGFTSGDKGFDATGCVRLMDGEDRIAAEWPYAKLAEHWKAKHASAAFIPSQQRKMQTLARDYRFGKHVLLGEGADFRLLLQAMHDGKVYYDPGIKIEANSSERPRPKKRSQFRVSSKDLPSLYKNSRVVDVCNEAACTTAQRQGIGDS